MAKLISPLSLLMWVGGLVATIIAVVQKLAHLRVMRNVEMRSVLLLAAVLFLGAIATRVIAKPAGS